MVWNLPHFETTSNSLTRVNINIAGEKTSAEGVTFPTDFVVNQSIPGKPSVLSILLHTVFLGLLNKGAVNIMCISI